MPKICAAVVKAKGGLFYESKIQQKTLLNISLVSV